MCEEGVNSIPESASRYLGARPVEAEAVAGTAHIG